MSQRSHKGGRHTIGGTITRREFVKQATVGASTAAIAGVGRGYPANERIRLGWIGMGNRSEQLQIFSETGCLNLIRGMFYDGDDVEKRVGADSGSNGDKGTAGMLEDFFDNIRTGAGRAPQAGIETARNAALMGIMGRMAMANTSGDAYDPRVIRWGDLKTTTDPETKPA